MWGALLLVAAAGAARLGDVTRTHSGDVFTITEEKCNVSQCVEHGATAATSKMMTMGECVCVCPQGAPLFREDRELCVDDLPECSLAAFGTGVSAQRIPFVYLPLKGQIIHPSNEINFPGVKTPICAVSGAQFLTRKGFADLRNTLDADVPFTLFRDEGRTFLQWSGEDDVRTRMSGRLMVVRLLCRDVSTIPASQLDLRGVFTPCVAFRVQGTTSRQLNNVTEVLFSPNAQTFGSSNSSGLSITEYVAIGISSLLLGLIYVASVFLYLNIRKRRKAASEESSVRKLQGLKRKDGSFITEHDIVRINNEIDPTLPNNIEDEGIVKKNPLIAMSRQFLETRNHFSNDSGSNISDSEDMPDSSARSDENTFKNQTTSAVVHSYQGAFILRNENMEANPRDESGIEKLPDEHVSIVETTDDREISRPVGTTRRKLYFNPAYFEPHLMAEPPPAAIEFLLKIREVISIAKHKMAAKRFQPVLNQIPEEETISSNRNSTDLYQGLESQRSGSLISLKRENSRNRNCIGCPGCKTNNSNEIQRYKICDNPSACLNCFNSKGDKQNSIRKWLENIPTVKQQSSYNDIVLNSNQNSLISSLHSEPVSDISHCKLKKQNSFSVSGSMHKFSKPKNSTMSVRSEPSIRTYNLPLPDFDTIANRNNHNCYSRSISRTDDNRPINLIECGPNILLSNQMVKQRINKFITNKSVLPDMINEAIALDHCSKSYNQSSSDEEKCNSNRITNIVENSCIINNSESPLGNDYETDSLERITNKQKSISSEYVDISSSQASPSLSNALPLEEELTMRNAIYKTHSSNSNTPSPQKDIYIKENNYETIRKETSNENIPEQLPKAPNRNDDYSLVSEVYVNNSYNFGSTPTSPSGSESSMGSRKFVRAFSNNLEEKPGCLTIEVKDPPENYIKIHESDGFEPDTLDRKHSKNKEIIEDVQFSRKDLIESIENPSHQCIKLRNSGNIKKNNLNIEHTVKFNSAKYEYEQRKNLFDRPTISSTTYSGSKSLEDTSNDEWHDIEEWNTEDGRILTLELRHSKRQRQCTPINKPFKNLVRPDILPPLPPTEDNPIYEHPICPPKRVENDRIPTKMNPKNLNGRSLSPRIFTKNTKIDPLAFKNLVSSESYYGPSCSPLSASVQSQVSDNVNMKRTNKFDENSLSGICRSSNKKRLDRNYSNNPLNTNTYIKSQKEEFQVKRFRRKKGTNIEDSGYLSSDSTSSRQVQRKLIIAKIVSCSDSDDTENEARSESGAESIETHSVYFGSFRRLRTNENNLKRTINDDKSASRKNKNI